MTEDRKGAANRSTGGRYPIRRPWAGTGRRFHPAPMQKRGEKCGLGVKAFLNSRNFPFAAERKSGNTHCAVEDPFDFEHADPVFGPMYRLGKRICLDVPASVAEALGGGKYIPVLVNLSPGVIFRSTIVPRRGGKRCVFLDPGGVRVLRVSEGDFVTVRMKVDQQMVKLRQKRQERP